MNCTNSTRLHKVHGGTIKHISHFFASTQRYKAVHARNVIDLFFFFLSSQHHYKTIHLLHDYFISHSSHPFISITIPVILFFLLDIKSWKIYGHKLMLLATIPTHLFKFKSSHNFHFIFVTKYAPKSQTLSNLDLPLRSLHLQPPHLNNDGAAKHISIFLPST